MAVVVDRQEAKAAFHETWTEYRITEKYAIKGDTQADNCHNPALAQAFAGVPQHGDAHPDFPACLVIDRAIKATGPFSSMADITYSDNPAYTLVVDGPTSVVTYDMMGRTERQPWDLVKVVTDPNNAAIGANAEGAEVYRPNLSITFEHLESSVATAIYNLTGTTNDAVWNGFAKNTLLFLGATVREEGSNWRVTYHFLFSPINHVVYWRPVVEQTVNIDGNDYVRPIYGAQQSAVVYPEGNFFFLPIS